MNVFELQATISLQTQQFVNAIKEAIQNGNKLSDNMKKMRQPTEDEQKQLDALKNRLEMSKDEVSKCSDKVKELTEKFNESAKETGLTSEETKKYAKELEDAEKQLERSQKSEERVTRQLEELEHSLEETTDDVDELGDQSEKSGDKVSIFGEVLKANLASEVVKDGINMMIDGLKQLASLAGGFIKDSVSVSMAFDSSMGQVRATLGGASEDMIEYKGEMMKTIDALDAFAIETGGTTSFSASQAAEGINLWALAGKNGLEIMDAVPISMSLAKAGALDLATATRYLSVSQNALNLTTEETSALVDQMAATASNSGTDIGQLGDALLGIGGNASSLNGGFIQLANGEKLAYDRTTELNAAFGILGDNGTFAGEAGTALRNVLMGLSSDKFETNFTEALGIEAYDEATGKLRPLRDIFLEMKEATKDMSQQQLDDLLGNAFNVRSIKDIRAFLNTDAEKWDRLLSTIQNSEGWATSAGDAITNNLAGSITLFNSALETAHIKIGRSLTPELRNFVDMGASQITRLTDIFEKEGLASVVDQLPDIFNEWVEAITNFIENIASQIDLSKVLTSIAKALTTIIGQIPGIITNVLPQLLNGAIEAADIIVNGIFDTIETLFTADNMTGFFTSILDIIGKLGDFIGKNVGGLIDAAVAIVDALTESFYSPEVVSKIFETAASLVRSLVDGLTGGDHLQKLLDAALNITLKMQEVFMQPEVIESITEAAAIIVSELAKGILQALPQIANSLAGFAKNVVDYIINYDWSAAADGFVGGFMSGFDSMDWSFIDDVEQKWVDFWDSVASYWAPVLEGWSNFWQGYGEYIYDGIQDALQQWSDFWQTVGEGLYIGIEDIKTKWVDFFEGFGAYIYDEAEKLFSPIATAWGLLSESTAQKAEEIRAKWSEFWENVGTTVSTKITELVTSWTEFWENIGAKLAEAVENLKNKWDNFWADLGQKASDKIAEIVGFFQDIPNKLQEMAQNAWTWGTDMLQNFINGIRSKLPNLTSVVTDVASTIKNIIGFSEPKEGPLSNFHTYAPDMMNLFADGIRANAGKVEDEITSFAESMRIQPEIGIPDKFDYSDLYAEPETVQIQAQPSVSPYSAYTGASGAGVSPSLETIVGLLNGILEATQQGHYVSVTDIDTSLGRRQAAEIRRGI